MKKKTRLNQLFGCSDKTSLTFRILWTLGFLVAVEAATSFDLLNSDFDTSGLRLFLFNFSRSILVIYMGFAMFQLGHWLQLLQIGSKGQILPSRNIDKVILCTLFGAALASLVTFFLGLMHLYYKGLALGICLPLAWCSSKYLTPAWRWLTVGFSTLFKYSTPLRFTFSLLVLVMIVTGIFVTIVLKGLWLGEAGGDVYQHYLPYYREVITNHGLSPNSLWYHYYVSKGAGLFYFSMLLSDEMAPQLVTSCFILIYALIIYDLVTKISRHWLFGFLASISLIFVYARERPWGIFMKHHELMACWIIFSIWFLHYLSTQKNIHWSNYTIGATLFSCSFTIQFPTASALLLPLFGLAAIWFRYNNQSNAAKTSVAMAIGITISISSLLIYNQAQSGLAMDTPFRLFWKFANVEKFSEWASPYLVQYLDEGSSQGVGELISPFRKLFNFREFSHMIHLDDLVFLVPMPVLGILWLTVTFNQRMLASQNHLKRNHRRAVALACLGIGCLVAAVMRITVSNTAQFMAICSAFSFFGALMSFFSLTIPKKTFHLSALGLAVITLTSLAWLMANIVDQPVSIYRMFSFLCGISLIASFAAWSAIFWFVRKCFTQNTAVKKYSLILLILNVAAFAFIDQNKNLNWKHKVSFFAGTESAKQALDGTDIDNFAKSKNHIPCVWPPYISARKLVGLKTPILTFGIQGNIMGTSLAFPGRGLQSEVSYSLGPKWHDIAFGSADLSENELKKLGINYFLIDLKAQALFGSLPFSLLFSPAEFSKRFTIVEEINGVWLVTWKSEKSQQISSQQAEVWDLFRAGFIAPTAMPAARKQLVAGYLRILNDFNTTKANSKDVSEKLINNIKETTIDIFSSPPYDLSRETCESIGNIIPKLIAVQYDELDSGSSEFVDSAEIVGKFVDIALQAMQQNIAKKISLELPPSQSVETNSLHIPSLASVAEQTRNYKELYKVVEATYIYNRGATNKPITRKPGLARAIGWQ